MGRQPFHVRCLIIGGQQTVGRGCILELSSLFGEVEYPWLQPGDQVRLTVERLGHINARITAGSGTPAPLR